MSLVLCENLFKPPNQITPPRAYRVLKITISWLVLGYLIAFSSWKILQIITLYKVLIFRYQTKFQSRLPIDLSGKKLDIMTGKLWCVLSEWNIAAIAWPECVWGVFEKSKNSRVFGLPKTKIRHHFDWQDPKKSSLI